MPEYYRLKDLKLQQKTPTNLTDNAHSLYGGEDNEVRSCQWEKRSDKPEAWGCSFVRNQFRTVSATVKYKLLPDYAPVNQQEKKKRETWVWLAEVTVTDDQGSQTLADGYYFFFLKKAQVYCETAALMICEQLGISFPDAGAGILVDRDSCPITRNCRVIKLCGTEVIVSDFGWKEFYLECTDLNFQHSPLGYMQIRPTVKYLNANQTFAAALCNEVKARENLMSQSRRNPQRLRDKNINICANTLSMAAPT